MSKLPTVAEDAWGFTLFEGECFTIVAYKDPRGKSLACEFLSGLDKGELRKLYGLFERICKEGRIASGEKFRNEEDKIWAFKSFQIRLYCFFSEDRKIVLTHGVKKKQDRAQRQDIVRAHQIKNEFETRRRRK
jgi:mRNA-degrading endonuclease RelE of RelBE toxin-antitoxin system